MKRELSVMKEILVDVIADGRNVSGRDVTIHFRDQDSSFREQIVQFFRSSENLVMVRQHYVTDGAMWTNPKHFPVLEKVEFFDGYVKLVCSDDFINWARRKNQKIRVL